jgi:thioredoxin reductase
MREFDAVIIGGGPAGLSAALVLARACRRVAVINSGKPRNSASPGVFAFLSRDGILPADLKKISRKQIAGYPDVELMDQWVHDVRSADSQSGFQVSLSGGQTIAAGVVLLTVGMVDEIPDVPEFDRHWGRQIIHCPFCHGYENRGSEWRVIAKDLDDIELAINYLFWSDRVTIHADQRLHIPADLEQELKRNNIPLDRRSIRQFISSDDGSLRGIEMEDGSRMSCETVVYRPRQRHTSLITDIGVALSESGRVWVDDGYQTSIPGVFAAGDLTPGCQDVLAAAAEGAKAAKSALDALAHISALRRPLAQSTAVA